MASRHRPVQPRIARPIMLRTPCARPSGRPFEHRGVEPVRGEHLDPVRARQGQRLVVEIAQVTVVAGRMRVLQPVRAAPPRAAERVRPSGAVGRRGRQARRAGRPARAWIGYPFARVQARIQVSVAARGRIRVVRAGHAFRQPLGPVGSAVRIHHHDPCSLSIRRGRPRAQSWWTPAPCRSSTGCTRA